jgi:DNA-binding SARP family transcriptional activator
MPVSASTLRLLADPSASLGDSAVRALELRLLNAFELRCGGEQVRIPVPAQRLLALLALRARPLRRSYLAGVLWVESTDARASGSLRSALWKLRRTGVRLVDESDHRLGLSPAVAVDVHESEAWAGRVMDPTTSLVEADFDAVLPYGELLPDWYDDWVVLERERLRQVHSHALEAVAHRLLAMERFGAAIAAGLAAVAHEPYRESAHRAVICAHLAEGNRAEAARQYAHYQRLLADGLGLAPSSLMTELVRPISDERSLSSSPRSPGSAAVSRARRAAPGRRSESRPGRRGCP